MKWLSKKIMPTTTGYPEYHQKNLTYADHILRTAALIAVVANSCGRGEGVCAPLCTRVLCNTFKYAQKSAINSAMLEAAAEHVLYSGLGAAVVSICQHCVTGLQDRGSGGAGSLL